MQPAKSKGSAVEAALKAVPLSVRAPGARKVIVTGDFTGWSRDGLPLREGVSGDWRTILAFLPGEYQYRLIIDGRWCDDAHATQKVPNPYGSQNCVFRVQSEP
jgi:1,4-alpha-glucan branching enzyme